MGGEGALIGGVVRGSAARGTTTLYRAVSEAEALSVRMTGKFSAGPNSLGGKWFAETLEHAKTVGRSTERKRSEPDFGSEASELRR